MSSSESGAFAVPADLNALAPHIWPAGAARSTATGVVSVRGHDVREWPAFTWLAGAVCTIVNDHKNGVMHGGADLRRPAYVLGW